MESSVGLDESTFVVFLVWSTAYLIAELKAREHGIIPSTGEQKRLDKHSIFLFECHLLHSS